MDSNSALANVFEIVVPAIAGALVVGSVVLAMLKGRVWMSVTAVVIVIAVFVVTFGAFGFPEPSAEFQATTGFTVLNVALNAAGAVGLVLWILAAALPARPGTWWARRATSTG